MSLKVCHKLQMWKVQKPLSPDVVKNILTELDVNQDGCLEELGVDWILDHTLNPINSRVI